MSLSTNPVIFIDNVQAPQLSSSEESVAAATKRFDDFKTIDWVEESVRDNSRRLHKSRKPRGGSGRWRWRWNKIASLTAAAQGWLLLAAIGALIGCIAGSINIVTEWLSDIKTGHCTLGLYLNEGFCCAGQDESCGEWHPWIGNVIGDYFIYVILSVAFASASAFLVYSFAKGAAGSGISEIKCILAGFVMDGFLGAPILAIKSLALPLTIASGLSVGKEGPSVHYAACAGHVVASQFPSYKRSESRMREIVCACTAAGVAVAFGSPMGGVLFSVEEMSSSLQLKTMWRSYFCALIATGVLAAINPFRSGQLVLFSVKYDKDWHFFEILFFIILGIFGGLSAIFIIKWNFRVQHFRRKHWGAYAVQEIVILAFITAVICYFNAFLRMDMTESMQILFQECAPGRNSAECRASDRPRVVLSLLIAVILRTILLIFSYGAKVPAGIFVPSMAIGSLFGRLLGTLVQMLHEAHPNSGLFAACPTEGPCITPGTYAFLGAAAVLSGVMHITVTVVVIMFELTGALSYIVPTMIVVGVTKAVGDRWGKGGVADQAMEFNGLPFLHSSDVATNVSIRRAMTRNVTALTIGMDIQEIQRILDNHDYDGYPVVDQDNYLQGYVDTKELERKIDGVAADVICVVDNMNLSAKPSVPQTNKDDEEAPISSTSHHPPSSPSTLNISNIVNFSPITVQPQITVEEVVDLFQKMGTRVVLVDQQGILCGLLMRKDVLRYLLKNSHGTKDPWIAQQMDEKILQDFVSIGAIFKRKFDAAIRLITRR